MTYIKDEIMEWVASRTFADEHVGKSLTEAELKERLEAEKSFEREIALVKSMVEHNPAFEAMSYEDKIKFSTGIIKELKNKELVQSGEPMLDIAPKVSLREERKNEEVNPFGLNIIDMATGEEISQETEYDSFIMQDVLWYSLNIGQLEQLKSHYVYKINPDTGLYKVTVSDVGSDYYDLATMFNRMKNPIYAKKVDKMYRLLSRNLNNLRREYTSPSIEEYHGFYWK